MVGGDPPGGATPGLAAILESFLHMPSPEKLLAELQRLNNNMEIVAPDLHKLATALEDDRMADIRNLTEVLGKLDIGEAIRLAGQVYERLWGPR